MSSVTYASYLSSHNDNPYHLNHIYEFQELATMIAREQIELYMPKIEAMVNNAVSKAMNNAISGAYKGAQIDVNEIVNVVVSDLNKEFHSERLRKFTADTLRTTLEDALKNIDLELIIS